MKVKIKISRPIVLAGLFCIASFILIRRLYKLQILNGESYANEFELMTKKRWF